MKQSLEILELLMYLYPTKYIASSRIREFYEPDMYNKLNYFLAELIKKKLIKKRVPEILKPGGDKLEYMLDKTGVRLRKDLTEETTRILTLSKDARKTVLKQLLIQDTDLIEDITFEIMGELSELIEGKTQTRLQKKIYSIIKSHLS